MSSTAVGHRAASSAASLPSAPCSYSCSLHSVRFLPRFNVRINEGHMHRARQTTAPGHTSHQVCQPRNQRTDAHNDLYTPTVYTNAAQTYARRTQDSGLSNRQAVVTAAPVSASESRRPTATL